MSNIAQIDDDGLDTIALAFNLGLETLHLVTVEAVGDILALSDRAIYSHCVLRTRRMLRF